MSRGPRSEPPPRPDDFAAGALPVVEVGETLLAPPGATTGEGPIPVPVVVVAPEGHDAAALFGALGPDVIPEVSVFAGVDDRADPDDWRLRLDVDALRPVPCRFHVVLPLWPMAELLLSGVRAGGMVLASSGRWLWVDLDRRLAELVGELARRRLDAAPGVRTLGLPIEGFAALRTVLGILDDHLAIDPDRMRALDERLAAAWSTEEWAAMASHDPHRTEREIDLAIADAALLLDGLQFAEVASTGLPWFEQLVWVSDFVAGHLLGLWSADEWLDHRDSTG